MLDKPIAVDGEAEGDELESRVVDLALSGKLDHVGLEAVENHWRLGLPLTIRRGDLIVRLHPDGREEVLEHLPTLGYELPPNVRRLDPK
jgi:hypothetical protein